MFPLVLQSSARIACVSGYQPIATRSSGIYSGRRVQRIDSLGGQRLGAVLPRREFCYGLTAACSATLFFGFCIENYIIVKFSSLGLLASLTIADC